jgi:hypothetical protein
VAILEGFSFVVVVVVVVVHLGAEGGMRIMFIVATFTQSSLHVL